MTDVALDTLLVVLCALFRWQRSLTGDHTIFFMGCQGLFCLFNGKLMRNIERFVYGMGIFHSGMVVLGDVGL